jgi:hypothetical protein
MVNHINLLPQELLANGKAHPVTQVAQSAEWLEVQSVQDIAAVRVLDDRSR